MLRCLLRYSLFLTGLLGLSILVAWFSAPTLIELFAPRFAQSQGIQIRSIDIGELTLNSIAINNVVFDANTPAGNAHANIRDGRIDFSITNGAVTKIHIASAEAEWFPAPDISSDEEENTALPIIPITALIIDKLDLKVHLENNVAKLNGYLRVDQSNPGRFNLRFNDALYALSAEIIDSPLNVNLEMNEISGDRYVTVNYDANPEVVQIDANLKPLLQWARTTSWLSFPNTLNDLSLNQGHLHLNIQTSGFGAPFHASGLLQVTQFDYQSHNTDATLPFVIDYADQNLDMKLTHHAFVRSRGPDDLLINLKFEPGYQVRALIGKHNKLVNTSGNGQLHARISLPQTTLDTEVNSWNLQGWVPKQTLPEIIDIDLKNMTSTSLPDTMPSIAIRGQWLTTENTATGRGSAQIGNDIPLQWKSQHRLPSWTTTLNADLTQATATLWPAVEKIIGTAPQPIQFHTGKAEVSANLHWSSKKGVSAKGKLIANSVSAKIDQLNLSETQIMITASDLINPKGHFSIIVPQAILANGIEAGPFNTSGEFGGNYAQVGKATLDLYSGQISMKPARIFMDDVGNKLAVDIRDLDIGAIISDFGPGNLDLSGDITGHLPITFDQSGFAIHDAIIRSNGPGIIHYRSGIAGDLNIALKALENFHYKHFKANLAYATNGDYTMAIQFNGKNPDLYDGHPVEFNLNLEGNLPGFLRASILSGDFAGEAMKTLKKHGSQH